MKFKQSKRMEAMDRIKASKWANSKARRKNTQTKENWQKQKEARIKRLEAAICKGA